MRERFDQSARLRGPMPILVRYVHLGTATLWIVLLIVALTPQLWGRAIDFPLRYLLVEGLTTSSAIGTYSLKITCSVNAPISSCNASSRVGNRALIGITKLADGQQVADDEDPRYVQWPELQRFVLDREDRLLAQQLLMTTLFRALCVAVAIGSLVLRAWVRQSICANSKRDPRETSLWLSLLISASVASIAGVLLYRASSMIGPLVLREGRQSLITQLPTRLTAEFMASALITWSITMALAEALPTLLLKVSSQARQSSNEDLVEKNNDDLS